LASESGVTELALSISHEGDLAAAVVVASCSSGSAAAIR
jgi:phosphopantetheinyl transferase (holo-ACP synthase)